MIPKEKIEEVRERASIVDVISEYVPLKRKGRNFMGLCPFHSEKSPSFSVSEEKKIYHCFGCQESGDVIGFLIKKEGMEFPDAVRALASRYGITLPEASAGKGPGSDLRDKLFKVNREAASFFIKTLGSEAGSPARKYLARRGYGRDQAEVVRSFGIGFAPAGWEGLVGHLKRKKLSLEDAEKAGLVAKSRKGSGYYDRFRNRLVFPIADARGRVVGFGGRALDDSNPKYLNTPETPVFRKGEILYGTYQARRAIIDEKSAIIVEGYFDLLALHREGFKGSVATMGTSLTSGHIRSLRAYADTVYTLFDSDQAGRNAAARSVDLFAEEGVHGRVVLLRGDKDPDDFLRDHGPEAMKKTFEGSTPAMEFLLGELANRFDLTGAEGKGRFLDSALPHMGKVKNVAERDHYAGRVASMLSIPVDSVYEALRDTASGGAGGGGDRFRESVRRAVEKGEPGRTKKRRDLKELTVVRVLLKHPELFSSRVAEAVDAFTDPDLREAARAIAGELADGREVNAGALLDNLSGEGARKTLAGLMVGDDDGFTEEPGRLLDDSLERILGRNRFKDATLREIERLEDAGQTDTAKEMRRRLEERR